MCRRRTACRRRRLRGGSERGGRRGSDQPSCDREREEEKGQRWRESEIERQRERERQRQRECVSHRIQDHVTCHATLIVAVRPGSRGPVALFSFSFPSLSLSPSLSLPHSPPLPLLQRASLHHVTFDHGASPLHSPPRVTCLLSRDRSHVTKSHGPRACRVARERRPLLCSPSPFPPSPASLPLALLQGAGAFVT